MEASIDGYTQMTVRFSEEDLSQLESSRKIKGKIWRYAHNLPSDTLPLLVYLREAGGMKAFSLPRTSEWGTKKAYVVRLIPEAIRVIKEGKFVGFDFLSGGTHFRKVLISRDDIF